MTPWRKVLPEHCSSSGFTRKSKKREEKRNNENERRNMWGLHKDTWTHNLAAKNKIFVPGGVDAPIELKLGNLFP